MSRPHPFLAGLLLVAVLTAACGQPPEQLEVTVPTTTTTTTTTTTSSSPPSDPDVDLTRLAADIHAWQVAVWNRAVWQAELDRQEAARAAQRRSAPPARSGPSTPPPDAGGRCGGDLPPCWVKARESGGDYGAVNPTGCGGRGCYGGWQFDPRTWDATVRAMGRPDLVGNYLASPDEQDAAARHLWAGGAGCGHWAAC